LRYPDFWCLFSNVVQNNAPIGVPKVASAAFNIEPHRIMET
jgi:hypothetical protein